MGNIKNYLFLVALAVVAGCGKSEPAVFRLNMPEMVANNIVPQHQEAIANIMGAMFGTPDEPFALPATGLDIRKLTLAAGPVWSDEQGTGHGLYRRHCAHCHGISGDGRGPTALFLNPYPRDYRPGVFKFKSTYNPARPTDDDLRRIIMNGVPGTAMPAFALLPPAEVDALVQYVKYLSMRGQMEQALITYVADELDFDPITGEVGDALDPVSDEEQRDIIVNELLAEVADSWSAASESVIVPEEAGLPPEERTLEQIAASAGKGRELFYGTRANCVKCHGPTGLGDGVTDDYNLWNKAIVTFHEQTEQLARTIADGQPDGMEDDEWDAKKAELKQRRDLVAAMFPPRNAIPRNLRLGMYRGGHRPLDLYRKVYSGIAGTPMPGVGPATPGATGTLSPEEMWQLVDYVQSLPFEPASQPNRLRKNQLEVIN